jgi:hypothetical protein
MVRVMANNNGIVPLPTGCLAHVAMYSILSSSMSISPLPSMPPPSLCTHIITSPAPRNNSLIPSPQPLDREIIPIQLDSLIFEMLRSSQNELFSIH